MDKQVQAILKKLAGTPINHICSLHGPILSDNLEYYLNKKLLADNQSINYLLEMLILFKREELRYLESKQALHFKVVINAIDYEGINSIQIAKQIESINEASDQIKSHVNADLVWASLAQKL